MVENKQWEYYVETFGSLWKGTSDEQLQAAFAELGLDGWEVFSIEQLKNSSKVRIVARRPVTSLINKRPSWP